MLNFLLVAAATYLLYNWGIRLQIRAQLTGALWRERCGTACSLLAGTVVSLYITIVWIAPYVGSLSVFEESVCSTVLSILIGEYFCRRSNRLSLRLLAPLRSKKQER